MRVVLAANWWYRRGGLGAVMFDEAEGLISRGHVVIPFAAAHPDNLPAASASMFPPFRETQHAGREMSMVDRITTAASVVYNRDAARRFDHLLDTWQPDLVHLHNTARQLSPSVVRVARNRNVPVVLTAHDYGLVCPQGQLYKGDREACVPPNCTRGDVRHVILNRCVKGSIAASGLAAVEHLVHRALHLYTDVDAIVAPSRFMAQTLTAAGVPARRITVIPNGIQGGPRPTAVAGSGGHILFSGRLAREKGLDVLVAAARLAPDVPIVVAGDGPDADRLRATAPASVRFVGHQDPVALAGLLAASVAVVMPSTWYENAPISLVEALRAGRPVIATDLGGHPELLLPGGGILVPPGDPAALADEMSALWNDRNSATTIGRSGRRTFEQRHTLDRHLDSIEALYRQLVDPGDGERHQPARPRQPRTPGART
jgi:glycosyltransferase involved in cell wall biosynthesis